MEDEGWQEFLLYGRTLHVRQEEDGWRLRLDGREVTAVHLDKACAELLNVPSHMALRLALAILDRPPGSEIS